MLGFLVNKQELRELEYVVKRELDELIFDMEDNRIDPGVKSAMEDRYKVLFQLLKRFACEADIKRYIRYRQQWKSPKGY